MKDYSSLSYWLVCTGLFVLCGSMAEVQAEFTGNVTLSTDYVGRGVSQTQGGTALQGGFDWSHQSGLSVGIWASNIDFTSSSDIDDGADLELEYYADYSVEIASNWALSFGAIRFTFPRTLTEIDYDWTEYRIKLSYSERWGGSFMHSDNIFASNRRGNYLSIWHKMKFPGELELTAKLEGAKLDKTIFGGDKYFYGSLALNRSFKQLDFKLAFHISDSRASRMFDDIADNRLVFSVTKVF